MGHSIVVFVSAANFPKLVAAYPKTQQRVKTVVFWGAVEESQQKVSALVELALQVVAVAATLSSAVEQAAALGCSGCRCPAFCVADLNLLFAAGLMLARAACSMQHAVGHRLELSCRKRHQEAVRCRR